MYSTVEIGNPGLNLEEVDSFDVSAEWYFAPNSVFSVGYFEKDRTNIIVETIDTASTDINGFLDQDPNCPGGAIFNPIAVANVAGPEGAVGLCVSAETFLNDASKTTQRGVEFSFQYDLAQHEDKLGWASGFGLLANYTIQEFEGGSAIDQLSTRRGIEVFNAINGIYDENDPNFVRASQERGLLDFSENAYNVTGYYEKYGIFARARYTWREAFRTLDTAAGASLDSVFGSPVVTEDRGQLNAGINYDVNEHVNIGIEGVNLTESDITQSCVNEDVLLCAEGITDRRITFGATYTF